MLTVSRTARETSTTVMIYHRVSTTSRTRITYRINPTCCPRQTRGQAKPWREWTDVCKVKTAAAAARGSRWFQTPSMSPIWITLSRRQQVNWIWTSYTAYRPGSICNLHRLRINARTPPKAPRGLALLASSLLWTQPGFRCRLRSSTRVFSLPSALITTTSWNSKTRKIVVCTARLRRWFKRKKSWQSVAVSNARL